MKVCIECHRSLPLSEYWRRARARDGLAYRCKGCLSAKMKARRTVQPEYFRAIERAYKAANPEKKKEWARANAQHVRAYNARYVAENLTRYRMHGAARVARQLQATPAWADTRRIEAIYEECRQISAGTATPHHVDHIIPLRSKLVCGLHVQHNLQILTASENQRKHNKLEPTCHPHSSPQ